MRFVFRLNEEMWNNVKQGDDVLLARKHVLHARCCYSVDFSFFAIEF